MSKLLRVMLKTKYTETLSLVFLISNQRGRLWHTRVATVLESRLRTCCKCPWDFLQVPSTCPDPCRVSTAALSDYFPFCLWLCILCLSLILRRTTSTDPLQQHTTNVNCMHLTSSLIKSIAVLHANGNYFLELQAYLIAILRSMLVYSHELLKAFSLWKFPPHQVHLADCQSWKIVKGYQ